MEGIVEVSGTEGEEVPSPPRSKPRPKPRSTHRQPSDVEGNEGDDEDVFGPVSSPKVPSPTKRGAPKQAPVSHEHNATDNEIPLGEANELGDAPHIAVNGHHSPAPPSSPRKRRRESVGSEPEDPVSQQHLNNPSSGVAIEQPPPSPARSHISVADIKNRRKRVRR